MTEITRRTFISTIGAGALAAPGLLHGAASRKPNIIFFLGDDVGLDLIDCYGSDRYKTPHIDALASKGIRFETAYSTPLCGPTRCQFNTGRYPFRTGGLTNMSWNSAGGKGPRASDEFPIARMLKQAGYITCSSGKWRQIGETPGDWGYDEWLTDPNAAGWYWQKSYTKNGKLIELDREVYGPDVAHEFAMDFIRRHRNQPFFVYYPTHLIHGPIQRTPDSAPGSKDLFADDIAYMDKLLGKVVAEVEHLGLSENTVIVFVGDNGTAKGSGYLQDQLDSMTIGGRKISGAKGDMWEGGARVPLIVSWRGTTPEGKVLQDMVDFTDFYATFAELGGTTLPRNLTFDGRSFAPQLRGQKGNPREWVFVQLGKEWYVRDRGWKLNERGELYDMKRAPFEEKLVPAEAKSADTVGARKRLQTILDQLNPAGGKSEPAGFPTEGGGKAGKNARKGQRKKAAQ